MTDSFFRDAGSILFVQLPLVDHGYNYTAGNFQSAPLTLTAYLTLYHPRYQPEIMPRQLADYLGVDRIAECISEIEPDIIAFTCYAWNIEAHLYIAEKIKKSSPSTIIMMGGPEISSDSFVLQQYQPFVDIFYQGEGEWFFEKVSGDNINNYSQNVNGNRLIIQDRNDVVTLVEPFSNGFFKGQTDESIFVELVRGCPYRCSYCNYSKNARSVTEHDTSAIIERLEQDAQNIQEVYFLAPTLESLKTYDQFMKGLTEIHANNPDLFFHSEIRAARINREKAKSIARAGFRSLEVGLQTVNEKALAVNGRHSDIERELKGMEFLAEAGIDLKIGLIPGLPGDDPETFRKGIDLLCERGFAEQIEYYPLMVLPQTAIRSMADEYNLRYLEQPPYYLTSQQNFNEQHIRELKNYIEDATGLYETVYRVPDLCEYDCSDSATDTFCRGIYLPQAERIDYQRVGELVDSNVFNMVFEENMTEEILIKLIEHLRHPFNLYNVIFKKPVNVRDDVLRHCLDANKQNTIFSRMNYYREDEMVSNWQFFQIYDTIDIFVQALDRAGIMEPILELNSTTAEILEQVEEPPLLYIPAKEYNRYAALVERVYGEYSDKLIFTDTKSKKAFYAAAGIELAESGIELVYHTMI